ncbi:MAG: tetratricopeptide repeat protein [Planctomycetota bacterium]
MNSRLRLAFAALLVVELALGLGAIRWRLSVAVAPAVNLGRLPASTAADVRRLQQRVGTDRPAAWLELGEAYLAYGYFPQAEACLRRAANLTPHSFAAVYGHAYSLDRLCRLPEAEIRFRTAVAMTNGKAASNCWYHIGLNHLRREDAPQAEQAFLRAGDRHAPAVHARARLLIRSDRNDEALVQIEALRRELTLDIQTEMLAVQAMRALKNPVELARAAERADRSQERLRLSDHWEYLHPIRSRYGLMAQYSRARALTEQGKFPEAAQVFQSMLNSDAPEYSEGMFEQGVRLCLRARQSDDALDVLSRFQKRMLLTPSALHLWGDALGSVGRLDEAIKTWEYANRLLPDGQSYRSLSAAHARVGNPSQAERDLDLAALFQGIGAYRDNELEAALTELERAQRALKDDARPSFYLGETHFALSQYDKARAAYQRCIDLDPDHGRALERLDQLPK